MKKYIQIVFALVLIFGCRTNDNVEKSDSKIENQDVSKRKSAHQQDQEIYGVDGNLSESSNDYIIIIEENKSVTNKDLGFFDFLRLK